ncbi:cache domain-containing protein [Zobellella aerophila]|uniref:Histidine kinase n=1 Tax=Zobellella aerophila TaxID=870480 RepID=A0ABP6W1T5_9GAMM
MDEARLNQCATRINSAIASIFKQIDIIHDEVTAILQPLAHQGIRPKSADLSPLKSSISAHLTTGHPCIQGNGVVFAPNIFIDREMCCEWWHKSTGDRLAPLPLNFNQNSENYYNYIKMPWFSRPRETAHSAVIGPYVDLYGQDMYILTFSRPIHIGGEFVGIAGADIALHKLERILVTELMQVPEEALIVTHEGRVVAANTANWCAGDMAKQFLARDETQHQHAELKETMSHWTLVARHCLRRFAGAA